MVSALRALGGGLDSRRLHVQRAQAERPRPLRPLLRRAELHELLRQGRALRLHGGRRHRPARHPGAVRHNGHPAVGGLPPHVRGGLPLAADPLAVLAEAPLIAAGVPRHHAHVALLLPQHRPEQPQPLDAGSIPEHRPALLEPRSGGLGAAAGGGGGREFAAQDRREGAGSLRFGLRLRGVRVGVEGDGEWQRRQPVARAAGGRDLHHLAPVRSGRAGHGELPGLAPGAEPGGRPLLHSDSQHPAPRGAGSLPAAPGLARAPRHDRPAGCGEGLALEPSRDGPRPAVGVLRPLLQCASLQDCAAVLRAPGGPRWNGKQGSDDRHFGTHGPRASATQSWVDRPVHSWDSGHAGSFAAAGVDECR
mmetsp:Transcript_44070/g.137216  ORF Transcript_44070/g.137216 Transcript_44070/m.137216 type:complete len:363 (-) Transcript_44070:56-1144(-)